MEGIKPGQSIVDYLNSPQAKADQAEAIKLVRDLGLDRLNRKLNDHLKKGTSDSSK